MIEPDVTYEGLEEVQAALRQLEEALKGDGAAGELVGDTSRDLLAHARDITHVITGGLQTAHRAVLELSGDPRATIFIDPSSVNPLGERPYLYGPKEHAKGGDHAFYARTVNERGPTAVAGALAKMIERLPRGR